MNARGLKILVYPEVTIKLKAGKVVSLDAPKDAIIAPDAPANEPVPSNGGGRFRPAVWTTDYDDALKQAKDENRHVFVFFTGSDWCGWCHRLRDEVLSTPGNHSPQNSKSRTRNSPANTASAAIPPWCSSTVAVSRSIRSAINPVDPDPTSSDCGTSKLRCLRPGGRPPRLPFHALLT